MTNSFRYQRIRLLIIATDNVAPQIERSHLLGSHPA